MKFGLAAAIMIALTATAGVSIAAKKQEAPKIDAKARTQGMAEAPAIAQAAGITCQIADARFIGVSEDKKAKTSTSLYEVDCDKGAGYVLAATKGGSTLTMGCVETTDPDGKPANLGCILPGNTPKTDIAELMTAGGKSCSPLSYRFIGRDPKAQVYLEVQCSATEGYVIGVNSPLDTAKAPFMVANCLSYDAEESPLTCKLGDKSARTAIIDKYIVAGNNGCAVKDKRFVGSTTDGSDFFEASCQDGKGYMYKIDSKGAQTTIECAKAQGLLGGCTLTDARQAETEQAALYTRLSGAAGFTCDVAKYGIFPAGPNSEDVVELVCKDGKGGVGIFPGAGKGVVYDCGRALVAGYRCSLNKVETAYPALTEDLRKFDQKSCVVSNSRLVGKTTKGTILLEVACADGFKGYMIEYNTNPVNAVAATGCAFAAGCKLPGNT
jgi:hypothetical protein